MVKAVPVRDWGLPPSALVVASIFPIVMHKVDCSSAPDFTMEKFHGPAKEGYGP